ncbi:class I SAM-dependent methyltransferase [Methylocystis sp. WRRC1]|uniref:class I SAM-dependent methyltransferase n=1 Tax=Methylocystis sp. WRRC1 TaxID=1732014 RepID=UPI001D1530CB|nr:class I SAM-dependent methyltransferase [Methylocystis sp. WRRC1]MCC3244711.1 class I SAM-dependent methyltransferase [Methylocystis sp. WRRC1]
MNEPAAIRFFHVWDTYAKVVASNYMFHQELGAAVKAALRERFGDRPFSVLDLGCGDAATFAPLLEGFTLESYTGADLCQEALDLAARNLGYLSCPVELKQADMLGELAASGPQDIIYTSFALHHLPTPLKAEFFKAAAQKLNPGGLLLLVDVVREEDESLAEYHSAYCDWLRGHMVELDSGEQDAICEHLVNNDLPEPCSLLRAQAQAAGLQRISLAIPHRRHSLSVFTPA